MKTEFFELTHAEERQIKKQTRRLRKPPDVEKMIGIEVPKLRAIFYPATIKRRLAKIKELKKLGYDFRVINPKNEQSNY